MKKCLLALLFFLAILPAIAQDNVIKGKVNGPDGRPLEGITVTLKGTQTATKTDKGGNYTIHASGTNAHLVFSSIGYEQQDIALGSNTTVNATLKLKSTETEEVVVIGYGTVKKRDLTGSVAKVNMTDMMKAPVASFDQALAGRVAGVQVNAMDGQPGNAINIVVRGANSVTQSNTPLYVVDGFPIEDMNTNTLNPADIESIEVLKDASATAIYGARGANGVILITTKRGKTGPPVVRYNGYYGTQQNLKQMQVMKPYDFVQFQLESNPAGGPYTPGNIPTPSQLYLNGGTTMDYYKDTAAFLDYQDLIFQKAPTYSNTISVTGGNDKTKYAASGNIFDQKGMIITSSYKRYQGRFSLDQTVSDKFKVGINANYSYLERNGLSVGGSNFSSSLNLMYSVWGFRPLNPSPNSQAALNNPLFEITDQTETDPFVSTVGDYRYNPFLTLKNTLNKNITKDLITNGYLEYRIIPELTLRITGGYNDRSTTQQNFNGSKTASGSNPSVLGSPNGSLNFSQFTSFLNENYLTYNKTFNKVHNLSVMVGMSNQKVRTSGYGYAAKSVPNELLGINALQQGVATSITSGASDNTLASFLGRVNYAYKSKYLFTVSYRADGSSKFAPENRWAYFPSGAFAWHFSNEKFMDGLKSVISDAKLRATYGVTGNNRASDFPYLPNYSFDAGTGYVFKNQVTYGAYPSALGNRNLKWETTAQTDLGLEISFFKSRLSVEADIYNKITSNLLLQATIPLSSGYTTVNKNIGKVQNQGLELTLNSTNIQNKNFSWTSSFNISFNKNKLLQLAENQESLLKTAGSSSGSVTNYIAKVGQELGLMYGLIADGVYQYGDFDKSTNGTYVLKNEVAGNGNTRANIQPGDIKYKDLNRDGTINATDYTVIGRSLPVHIGGFTNNFTYKNFDLNIFFQWSAGNDIMNANNYSFNGGSTSLNQFESFVNRWTPTHTNTNLVRTNGFFGAFPGASTYYIEDGSYLRLKTLALGYNVPPSVLKHIKIKAIRAYSSVQNLLTWTNYSGQDPEVSLYNSVLTGGYDYSSYPKARTITLGLDVTF